MLSNATVLPTGKGARSTNSTPIIAFSPYFHTTVQALGPASPTAEVTTTDETSTPYFHTTVPALASSYVPHQSHISQSATETLTPYYHTTVEALGPTDKPAAQVTTAVPIAHLDSAPDNRPSVNGQTAGGSGGLRNSLSVQISKQSPEPENQGQQSGLPSLVVSDYVAAGQTIRPIRSDAVELGGATIFQGAPAKTVGGEEVSLGTSNLAIGSSSIPLPTPAVANPPKTTLPYYVVAGETVIPHASNEVIVGGSTIIEGAQAQTVGGTKVSLGSSGLVIGSSTVPLPTAATGTASLGGLIMSGLGPGPSSSQTSSSIGTAIVAATGDGASVGRGQRIWLRPGKKYLLGRTKDARRVKGEFMIDGKAISRKHVTLSVSPVKAGNGSSLHTRSEVTIKDENTKFGTEVDGVKIEAGAEKLFKNDEHTFRLGKEDTYFRVKWQPVVLTFSFSKKDTKDGKDPLVDIRGHFEQLDIKTIIPYIAGTTTHVVQTKRNTAKGLQALINAKYIVTNSFTDALVEATTPGNLNEDESMSLLEEGYDKYWPDALQFLPAKSKEPNERPAEYFAPNPERQNIFEGYSFVFCDQVQFETLLPPITNAGGKAFKFLLQLGKTTAEEIVRFVKEHAGEKSLGEFEDDSGGRGVVVVRFRGGNDEHQQWALDLGNQVALALGQRLIEQSEFMDAILTNDAKILRRPLQVEDEQAATNSTSREVVEKSQERSIAQGSNKAKISQPPSRHLTRGPVRRRFKGFDDDDDDTVLPDPTKNYIDSPNNASVLNAEVTQQPSFSRLDSNSQINGEMQNPDNGSKKNHNSTKRPAPPSDDENEEDFMDSLAPAATAIKRRRLEEQEEARLTGKKLSEASFLQSQIRIEPPKPKKIKKEINIKDAVRERREAEEERARQDEENLRDTLEGMSVEEMKKLAVVEEMEVLERSDRPQRREANGGVSDRWDPVWNGRRNFKRFRRQGENSNVRRGRSVMVPLEEVKKKDFGIGEEYWDEPDNKKKKRKDKERATQSQSQTLSSVMSQHTAEIPPELMTNGEDHEVIDVDGPRTTTHTAHTQEAEESDTGFQAINGKRPAPSRAKAPPAKKQKVLVAQDSESDSDDDELKFRFKKKR